MDPDSFVLLHLRELKHIADECDALRFIIRDDADKMDALVLIYGGASSLLKVWENDVRVKLIKRLEAWPIQLGILRTSLDVLKGVSFGLL
jgi:molybdopterin biosynthesis enzyme